MKRIGLLLAGLLVACVVYVLAHWALIEVGREVIVLRTEEPDGQWVETRLWIVDDEENAWLHGGSSRWVRNLRARPMVEIQRQGETRTYRAEAIPGPHPEIDALLRQKYGLADRWVRFVGPDTEITTAVRLESIEASH